MKVKSTKSALLMSFTSLLLCFAMLIGCTFAWFTDTATASVNKIQSGKLDVALVDGEGNSLEGETLTWVKANGHENDSVLWEPGCTYDLPTVYVRNDGNLALRYKIAVTGIKGDAKLNEAIVWTMKLGEQNIDLANGEYYLLEANATSAPITISGHMKEDAGNEYQDLSIDGIGITVYATQYTHEFDSTTDQYDAGAMYPLMPEIKVTKETEVAVTAESALAADAVMSASTIPAGTVLYTEHTKEDENKLTDTGIDGKLNEKIETKDATADTLTVSIDYTYTQGTTSTPIKAFSQPIMHTVALSKGLTKVKVKHGDTYMTKITTSAADLTDGSYFYDDVTGTLSILSSTYSDFVIEITNDFVAATKGQGYKTLEEAVAVVQENGTITLLKDIKVSNSLVIAKNLTLDLAGKTITDENWAGVYPTAQSFFYVKSGAKLTVNDSVGTGAITTTNEGIYGAICMTIGGDATNNDTTKNAVLVVNGGTLCGYYYGVCCNGNRHNTEITVNGGMLTGTSANDATSIYHPCQGKLTINGGTLKGYDGIAIKGGTPVTITGGEFIATGTKVVPEKAKSSGCNSVGSALYVEGNYGYGAGVTISGGTFKTTDSTAPAVLSLFNEETQATISITGGTFSSDPSAYVAEGYEVKQTTAPYTVTKIPPAATIDNVEYANLQAAINAANEGDTIVVGRDGHSPNGLELECNINKNVTIDLNGHSLTKDKSNGQCLNVKEGANVTIKNGTFKKSRTSEGGTDGTGCFVEVASSATCTLENCSFENAEVRLSCNADVVGTSNLTLKDCTFTDSALNVVGRNGDSNAAVELNGCKFVWNKYKSGKVEWKVYNVKGTLNIKDTSFTYTEAKNANNWTCSCIDMNYNNPGKVTVTLDGVSYSGVDCAYFMNKGAQTVDVKNNCTFMQDGESITSNEAIK